MRPFQNFRLAYLEDLEEEFKDQLRNVRIFRNGAQVDELAQAAKPMWDQEVELIYWDGVNIGDSPDRNKGILIDPARPAAERNFSRDNKIWTNPLEPDSMVVIIRKPRHIDYLVNYSDVNNFRPGLLVFDYNHNKIYLGPENVVRAFLNEDI